MTAGSCGASFLTLTFKSTDVICGSVQGGQSIYVLLTGLLGTLGGTTWLLEEREVQKVNLALAQLCCSAQ